MNYFYILKIIHYICILNKITMGRIKEIYIEIQEKLGEDVEVTQEIFTQHLIEKGIYEQENLNDEEQ